MLGDSSLLGRRHLGDPFQFALLVGRWCIFEVFLRLLVDVLDELDVLLDDRDERPGFKFKDADLLGIPVRVTIGKKSIAEGKVELKLRREKDACKVDVDDATTEVAKLIEMLKAEVK